MITTQTYCNETIESFVGGTHVTKQYTQHFGGEWTQTKLNIFTNYLEAYLKALKNQKFDKIYIDAFAGTGKIVTQEGEMLEGSAKCALQASILFDHYYFIEADKQKWLELQEMIQNEFSAISNRITVLHGDANELLLDILEQIDWRYSRGLLFLDPCATEVNWSTLISVANTKAIDLWYLFPFSALNRLLKKDGNLDTTWADCIDRLLGDTGWRKEFYKQDSQQNMFDILEEEPKDRLVKKANTDKIREYILARLRTLFEGVSKNSRILRNSKGSPLFLFCFAVSNPSAKAQALAMKIADHILNSKKI